MKSILNCLRCGTEVERKRKPSQGMMTFCSEKCRSAWRLEQSKKRPKVLPESKVCRDCGVEKPSSDFYQSPTHADGLYSNCISCVLGKRNADRHDNLDEFNADRRERYARDPKYRQRQMNNSRRRYYKDLQASHARAAVYREQSKDSRRVYDQMRYQAKKDWVAEIKSRYACSQCGETHPAVLDFHHLDPSDKIFNISEAPMGSWTEDEVIAEIAKCEVMCSNCHRKMHYEERRGKGNIQPPLPLN